MLVLILVAALALRLRNIDHGLPLVFDVDENRHFVRPAMNMFDSALNPHYFQNPAAVTDLFHAIFRFGFRQGTPFGEHGLIKSFRAEPTTAFVAARVAVALLGTLAVLIVYRIGGRCFDRRVGLIAAALLAVAFLPYHYSTLALPDAPLLAAVGAATLAALRAFERGRSRDFAIAGAAAGLAIAVKYLAAPLLVSIGLAALLRRRDGTMTGRAAVRVLGIATAAALFVFLALNPYALLDFDAFRSQVSAQAGVDRVLAQEGVTGLAYYAWTLTWGLGWAPIVAAVAGLGLLARADPRRALLLASFPVLLLLGVALGHPRFYGRYLLGAYPALCVLAAYGAVRLADLLGRGRARRARLATGLLVAGVLCAQGLIGSVRVSGQLGRADTRVLAARWFAAHVPAGSGVVLEPSLPARLLDVRRPGARGRYRRYPTPIPPGSSSVYTAHLTARWVDRYRRDGFCWVVVTSLQRQRGVEAGLTGARAYYQRLDRESAQITIYSPYRRGARPVAFNYDASYNGLSRAFHRPGPVVEIHRLRDCPATRR